MAEQETRGAAALNSNGEQRETRTPRIIVQGGAYTLGGLNVFRQQFLDGIREAAKVGYARLVTDNGTAVDAVEAAVCYLEDNPYFNAGYGSFLTEKKEVECDAMIMDGKKMSAGAVITVSHFRHPVSLSRKIMDESSHCALSGEGALEFARSKNFPTLEDPNELKAPTSLNMVIQHHNFDKFVEYHYAGKPMIDSNNEGHDTVSAVALDANGNFACAASTGGIPGKLKGRVGDVPMIGCGGYANEYGAATTTGHGERLMKMTLAREVVYNMERERSAQISAEEALSRMFNRVEGHGGVIAIDKNGEFGKSFNTDVMIWATVKDGELNYGLDNNNNFTENL
ncbi:isoaspartyl peptidase/L-asparaginase-like [Dendronephthya gigantea]|uniref:isoaspartyl peptidase/L-asparaginase-like n=1 Tax=Dendronephthya gigantea TaxID=151771 RepID=UPI00106B38FA|nr:isoaspartyl peptidase/L-asparaginase-like [Dendronephthya gigantea]